MDALVPMASQPTEMPPASARVRTFSAAPPTFQPRGLSNRERDQCD